MKDENLDSTTWNYKGNDYTLRTEPMPDSMDLMYVAFRPGESVSLILDYDKDTGVYWRRIAFEGPKPTPEFIHAMSDYIERYFP